jgi:hypothetical protein
MDAKDHVEELPFRFADDEGEYIRLEYTSRANSARDLIQSRTVHHDPAHPKDAYVNHTLSSGDTIRFKGEWTTSDDSLVECVLLFGEDEAVCVPLAASVIHLEPM